jgi:hypothetical protein
MPPITGDIRSLSLCIVNLQEMSASNDFDGHGRRRYDWQAGVGLKESTALRPDPAVRDKRGIVVGSVRSWGGSELLSAEIGDEEFLDAARLWRPDAKIAARQRMQDSIEYVNKKRVVGGKNGRGSLRKS